MDVARYEEEDFAENLARWHIFSCDGSRSTFGQGTVDEDGAKPTMKSFIENINE